MLLPSPIFRKLLLSALALIGVTLVLLDFYLTRYTARRQVAAVEAQLELEARILKPQAVRTPVDQLQPLAKQLGDEAQARMTIIDADGVVLADSKNDPKAMENHAGRPEIRTAYAGGTGFSCRHSATMDTDLCYLAAPLGDRTRPGWVIRLALPLRDLDASIAAVRKRIIGSSAAAAALALAMAWYFSRRITRRVSRLQVYAEHIIDPGASDVLKADANDELGALAVSLSKASRRLRGLLDKVSLESARREAILGSMVEGVLAVDSQMRVVFCNEAFARAAGARFPVPEMLPVIDLVRDPELLDALGRVLAGGESMKQRLQLRSADNRWFEIQFSALSGGNQRGALALLHDITELERLERVRKDFVANVSHELRTPLTAIRGYAETLLDGALEDPEYNRKFLETIRAHAIRLNNIASDLLVLSELESEQAARSEPELVVVGDALESALHTVESEARLRNVRLVCGRITPAEVVGSKLRLEQALVNLLDNAVKFNRPGGEVRVDVERTPDRRVRITVADNGIGIPSEDLPRIFERFYRVDKARSREVGGTGLGLSIVKHVIERAGGAVRVASQLGSGSTFTVLLPAA